MTELIPCPAHPRILLPVPTAEAARHLCPICAQEQRRATYETQRAEFRQPSPRVLRDGAWVDLSVPR